MFNNEKNGAYVFYVIYWLYYYFAKQTVAAPYVSSLLSLNILGGYEVKAVGDSLGHTLGVKIDLSQSVRKLQHSQNGTQAWFGFHLWANFSPSSFQFAVDSRKESPP